MARFRCNSCGGEYDSTLADGSEYYHACPPAVRVAVDRGGAPTLVDVTDLRATDVVTVFRAGARVKVAVSNVQPDDVRLGDVTTARARPRDENVTGPAPVHGQRAPIRAPGTGVTPL
jgi:hypothetical protein